MGVQNQSEVSNTHKLVELEGEGELGCQAGSRQAVAKIVKQKLSKSICVSRAMTDSNLIEQAKLGDPQAIAALMNQSLEPRGMRASVDRQGDCLEVLLEAERIPNRQSLTTFVQKGINNLGMQSIRSIRILGQQFGASYPAWMQELQLDATSPFADFVDDLEIAPSPIQPEIPPETASNFSPAEAEARTGGLAEFDRSPLTEGPVTESSELWDEPVDQPDFLQELIATDRETAGAIEEPLGAEPEENLIDFLNELSDAPPGEPFPTEIAQVQASLAELHATEGAEPADFPANFNADLSLDAADTADSEFEPPAWEDSTETVVSGEPDQDLIDFIKTPESPESLPDESLLNEYPDAASIDQLPDDWMTDASGAPEVTDLPEPSPAFLSELMEPLTDSTTDSMPNSTTDSTLEALPVSLDSIEEPQAEPIPLAETLPADFPTWSDSAQLEQADSWVEDGDDQSVSSLESLPDFWPEQPPDDQADLQQSLIQPLVAEGYSDGENRMTDRVWEPIEMPESTPDFMAEPVLNLPESDPAEMTLTELQRQPDVLEAAIEEPGEFAPSLEAPFVPSAAILAGAEEEDVEEIPPDFLLELQDVSSFSGYSAPPTIEPEPQLGPLDDAMAMEMAAALPEAGFLEAGTLEAGAVAESEPLALDSDLPELPTPDVTVAADGLVESPDLAAELAALDLSAGSEDFWTDTEAGSPEALDEAAASTEMSQIEPLNQTVEGTAIEPPEDWIATAGEGSADSAVSQADLEAGLGDFQQEFVPSPSALPSEAAAAVWPAHLSDPLSLDEEDEEANYILEDSTVGDVTAPNSDPAPSVYTLPPIGEEAGNQPAPIESQPESPNPRSSWIYPIVLLVICGWLAGLLGFSLFWSRMKPQLPSEPTPDNSPPAAPPASP